MFSKLRLRRKFNKVGSRVDESYMIYVNNDDPIRTENYEEAIGYLQHYRDTNVIFKLQIFRIETYSL